MTKPISLTKPVNLTKRLRPGQPGYQTQPYQPQPYQPKHRRYGRTDLSPTYAMCGCAVRFVACPRHEPMAYADAYAKHATDSVAPGWHGREVR